jgi:AcrR family transcriptional regulator
MTTESADLPPAIKRRNRPQRATSDELVQAALRVIAREGVAATTTRKIADEAGVPLGTVHYWFADKNDLLEQVVREVVRRLEAAVTASGAPRGGTVDDIRDGLHAAWAVIAGDDPGAQLGLYELTALALRTPAMRQLAQLQYASYRELVGRSLALAPADLDAQRATAVTELIAASFDGLCLAWLADPEGCHPAAVLDLLAELLGHVLTGNPPHGADTPLGRPNN